MSANSTRLVVSELAASSAAAAAVLDAGIVSNRNDQVNISTGALVSDDREWTNPAMSLHVVSVDANRQ